jgi:hypothetical protein
LIRYVRNLAVLSILLTVATSILAQEPPHIHFQRFEVAIWPEYDQPAVLVMYRGMLSPDVQLPVTVSLPIPAAVAVPSAVAKRGPTTGLLVAPYTIEDGENWNIVHLQADLPEIRLEFYLDLETSQPARSFTFEWPGGPEIDVAAYEVMQPLGATDFSVAPSSAPPGIGQDGLTYQREELGPVPEGGSFFVQFSYNKATPDLTASALKPVAPPQEQTMPPPVAAQTTEPSTVQSAQPADNSVWFVVIPIVFAAGLAAGWILLSTKKEKPS